MISSIQKVAALLGAATLSACTLLPHTQTTRPLIEGRILVDGTPYGGLPVKVCTIWQSPNRCEWMASTVTDSRGKFVLGGSSEFVWTPEMPGGGAYKYTITVENGGHVHPWSFEGPGPAPSTIGLVCLLNKDEFNCSLEREER